jgi:hypothetical protein
MNRGEAAKAIRRVLEELGVNTRSNVVIGRLREAGIEVRSQQVSNEKKRFRERHAVDDLPISVIKKVQALSIEIGSASIVRRALDLDVPSLPIAAIHKVRALVSELGSASVVRRVLDVDDLPVSAVKRVNALVSELGSASVVRRALDELEAITKRD